jgi:hypothetical protein
MKTSFPQGVEANSDKDNGAADARKIEILSSRTDAVTNFSALEDRVSEFDILTHPTINGITKKAIGTLILRNDLSCTF